MSNHIGRAELSTLLFLTVPEAASLLRADPRTVRHAIDAGDITAVRINGVVRIPTQRFLTEVGLDLEAFTALADEEPAAEASAPVLALVDRPPPDPSVA